MELYIDRDELLRGLSRVQGIVDRRNTPNPVLSHVLLQATEGRLRLTATDTEVAFIGDFAANVQSEGELAVHAAHFFQIVRMLPASTVHLKRGGQNRLEVASGSAWYKVLGLPGEEYPPLPEFDGQATMKLPAESLKGMIEKTAYAICPDDNRYGINGAHLQEVESSDGPVIRMVATDGHRLSYAESTFDGEFGMGPRLLLPRKAVSEIKKLCEVDEELEVTFGEHAALVRQERARFYFRLLDGEFPDYSPVIPDVPQRRVVASRDTLSSALKRMSLLAADKTRPVRFAFDLDRVTISAQNSDIGEAREEVPIELEGAPMSIGFNVKYFNDIMSIFSSDQVVIELGDALSPAIVRQPGDDRALYVVMPMRLD